MQLEIPNALDVGLTRTLAVLSAMITPAVLISACASLTISTSNRLTRTIARAREVSKLFQQLMDDPPQDQALLEEERDVLFQLLQRATRRSKILQRAMTSTYLALGVFVATSVAVGIAELLAEEYAFVAVALGILGAALLFYASILLIMESRIALAAIQQEMDFVWQHGQLHASEQVKMRSRRRRWFRP